MSTEPTTRLLGRYEYTVTPLGGRAASKLLARVFNRVGPVLQGIDIKSGAGAEIETLKAIAALLGTISDADVDYLWDAFIPCTRVALHPGQPESLFTKLLADQVFAGESVEQLEWLKFCFEVNFGPFLAGLRARMAVVTAPASSTPDAKPAP